VIKFSPFLVIAAFVLLAAGVVTSQLALVYLAIAVGVVSLFILVVGILRNRDEVFSPKRAPDAMAEPAVPVGSPRRDETGRREEHAYRDELVYHRGSGFDQRARGYQPEGRPQRDYQGRPAEPVPSERGWDAGAREDLGYRPTEYWRRPPAESAPAGLGRGQSQSVPAQPGEPAEDGDLGPSSDITQVAAPADSTASVSAEKPASDGTLTDHEEPAPAGEQAARDGVTSASEPDTPAAESGTGDAPTSSGPSDGAPGDTGTGDQGVTVVPGVPRYHRSECILIRFMGEDDLQRMPLEGARDAGCTPCRACQPDGEAG
jgi:hypothetical protein